jgi:predicted double-glycine peptidase
MSSRNASVVRTMAALMAVSAGAIADRSTVAAPPVVSLLEIRQSRVVIQQWDLSCGAAALATVLTYQHGDPVSEKEVAEGMLRRTDPLRVRVRGGFSLLDLKRFVETRGYEGVGYMKLTLDNLREFGPTVVPLNLKGYSHFVVFKGVVEDRVLVADPGFGNRRLTVPEFTNAWVDNIGFVVKRSDGGRPARNLLVPQANEAAGPPDIIIRAAVR